MVATRRGAQTGADLQTSTAAQPKASQRGRRAAPASTTSDEPSQHTNEPHDAAEAHSTTSRAARQRRKPLASTTHEQPDSTADQADASAAPRSSRAATLRSRKAHVTADEQTEVVEASESVKRRSRRNADKKKEEDSSQIDQVAEHTVDESQEPTTGQPTSSVASKPQTVRTRKLRARAQDVAAPAIDKTSEGGDSQSSIRQTRQTKANHSVQEPEDLHQPTTRKRKPLPAPSKSSRTTRSTDVVAEYTSEPPPDAAEVVNKAKTKTAKSSQGKARRKKDKQRAETPETDLLMSSRSTTPSLSPTPHFEQPKDLSEDRADAAEAAEASEEDQSNLELATAHHNDLSAMEESEDELAGPKTPMRRSRRPLKSTKQDEDRTVTRQIIPLQQVVSSASVAEQSEDMLVGDMHGNINEHTVAEAGTLIDDRGTQTGVEESTFDDSIFNEDTLFPQVNVDDAVHEQAAFLEHSIDVAEQPSPDQTLDMPDDTILVGSDDLPATASDTMQAESVHASDKPQLEVEEPLADDAEAASDAYDDDEGDDYTRLTINPRTPKPQTINWYHVEPNTALRDTLDLGLSPNVPQDEQPGILPDVPLDSPSKAETQTIDDVDDGQDIDQTVDFTDFVTMPSVVHSTPLAEGGDSQEATYQSTVTDTDHDSAPDVQAELATPAQPLERQERDQHVDGQVSVERSTALVHDGQSQTQPHYMLPTKAFDARRKTLPTKLMHTPRKAADRPHTSDGRLWSMARTDAEPWWLSSAARGKHGQQQSTANTPSSSTRILAPFALTAGGRATSRLATPSKSALEQSRQSRPAPHTVAAFSKYRTIAAYPIVRSRLGLLQDLSRSTASRENNYKLGRSPARTPLRSITGAASAATMTPHPAMPLRGVVAIVEVYTSEGASASAPFTALLQRLGAKTTKIWSDRVTHVVYKDGPPTTLQRAALQNKRSARSGSELRVHCVNSRWVSDCDTQSRRMPEADEAYIVSTDGLAGSAKRKRRSMEPTTMINVDGQLLRDRRSSWGRDSASRYLSSGTPSRSGSPLVGMAAASQSLSGLGKTSSADAVAASPATPSWLAAPGSLLQSTAPVKRVRRLAPLAGMKLNARRLTDTSQQPTVKR